MLFVLKINSKAYITDLYIVVILFIVHSLAQTLKPESFKTDTQENNFKKN